MSLKDVVRRLKASPEELEVERLQARFGSLGTTPIAEMGSRQRVRIAGEVKRMRIAPRSGVPALEIVIEDGTGRAVAVFTGRRELGGVEHGRALTLEGVPYEEHGRRIILNPVYTLLPV